MKRMSRRAPAVATLAAVLALFLAGSARGANGDPLIVGSSNSGSAPTTLYVESDTALEIGGAPAIQANGMSGLTPTIIAREGGNNTDIASSAGAAIYGVTGSDEGGIGVLAASSPDDGVALGVRGRAIFQRSGTVAVAFPARSVTVSAPQGKAWSWLRPPYGQSGPKALVLATLQSRVKGVYVTAAVPDPKEGSFTIYLNRAPGTREHPAIVRVAWFIVN